MEQTASNRELTYTQRHLSKPASTNSSPAVYKRGRISYSSRPQLLRAGGRARRRCAEAAPATRRATACGRRKGTYATRRQADRGLGLRGRSEMENKFLSNGVVRRGRSGPSQ